VALTASECPMGLPVELHRIFPEAQAMPELPSSPAYLTAQVLARPVGQQAARQQVGTVMRAPVRQCG
jgi:hypothetical protein